RRRFRQLRSQARVAGPWQLPATKNWPPSVCHGPCCSSWARSAVFEEERGCGLPTGPTRAELVCRPEQLHWFEALPVVLWWVTERRRSQQAWPPIREAVAPPLRAYGEGRPVLAARWVADSWARVTCELPAGTGCWPVRSPETATESRC